MAERDAAGVTAGQTRPRWRFSIGQLFVLVAIVGSGLALFNEYRNDTQRKRRQFDPVPLEVNDPDKIHVRLIPYHVGSSFLYRVHLPERLDYELCVAETKDGDPDFPVPQTVIPMPVARRLPAFEGNTRKPLPVEVRIAGFNSQVDKPSNTHRLILRAHSQSGGVGHQLGEKEISTIRSLAEHETWSSLPAHETKSYAPDENVVLWREVWKPEEMFAFSWPLPLKGAGLTVWIRQVKSKPDASPGTEPVEALAEERTGSAQ